MIDALLFLPTTLPKVLWGLLLSMKLWVVLPAIAILLLLRWRKAGPLAWALAWFVGLYVVVRFGFKVPLPSSVITIYMAIAGASILAYLSAERGRWKETLTPLHQLITEPGKRLALAAVVVALPLLVAAGVYARMSEPLEAPGFGRTVHPSPPGSIEVHEHAVNLTTAENPLLRLRDTNPEEYAARVENGRKIYYQNCFYCHGDGMAGDGMFAYGLNPIPTNFTDAGVLPNFQESFFFWRVAKGGPGLPDEGGPWDTAMPAWDQFFEEDELWDVVRFLYEFNDYQPRALGHEVAGGGAEHTE